MYAFLACRTLVNSNLAGLRGTDLDLVSFCTSPNRNLGAKVALEQRLNGILGYAQRSELRRPMKLKSLDNPVLSLDVVMAKWPQTIPVFLRHRMLFVGCMVSPFHTVEDACAEYGLDVDAFYVELFAALTPSHLTA